MAFMTGEDWRKPALFASAALALIGWLLAGYLWTEAVQTEARMAASLRAAERARENLAADLQNLQKLSGTAASLKFQAMEAEKALSEAAGARASAQNEIADLTRQITDAKLAISGAQEEATARARDLQDLDARLKEENDRLAAMQGQDRALASAQSQVAEAQRQLQSLQNQISAATAELSGLQQQLRNAGNAAH